MRHKINNLVCLPLFFFPVLAVLFCDTVWGVCGLFDTEGLMLIWGLQDVVWGVWDCLILKDWCCTGCGVGCVGLFDTEGLVLYRMWCGVCGAV